MTLSEQDLADLSSRLATTVTALAATAADTVAAQAGLDATRAATDKTRAEAEQVRAATEQARTSAADAHLTAVIARATAAVPDIGAVKPSTVTFGDDAVLHQGEAVARALEAVAEQVAKDVSAVGMAAGTKIWVTSSTDLVRGSAAYLQLAADAERVKAALDSAVATAQGSDVRRLTGLGTVAAVVGTAVTQLASLFEVAVTVGTARGTVPARAVQAAVIRRLLGSGLAVLHDTVRVTSAASPLLVAVHEVVGLRQQASVFGDSLDATIARLTPKPASGASTATPDPDAADRLAKAKTLRADLTRATTAADVLASALAAVDANSGASALAAALAIEPLVLESSDDRVVLSIGAADAESEQAVVTRRLFWPRVHVSTSVGVDFLLLRGERVVAAGRRTATCTMRARIGGTSVAWEGAQPVTEPADQ